MVLRLALRSLDMALCVGYSSETDTNSRKKRITKTAGGPVKRQSWTACSGHPRTSGLLTLKSPPLESCGTDLP